MIQIATNDRQEQALRHAHDLRRKDFALLCRRVLRASGLGMKKPAPEMGTGGICQQAAA